MAVSPTFLLPVAGPFRSRAFCYAPLTVEAVYAATGVVGAAPLVFKGVGFDFFVGVPVLTCFSPGAPGTAFVPGLLGLPVCGSPFHPDRRGAEAVRPWVAVSCDPDRRAAPFAARSGGIAARSQAAAESLMQSSGFTGFLFSIFYFPLSPKGGVQCSTPLN